ncbi:MAG: NAD(+) diphosphatase [Kangiellaceae bacterium]
MKKHSLFENSTSIHRHGENRENTKIITDTFYSEYSRIILIYKGRFICKNSQLHQYRLSELLDSTQLNSHKSQFINARENRRLPTDTIYLGKDELSNISVSDSAIFLGSKSTDSIGEIKNHLFVVSLDHSIALDDEIERLDSRSLASSSDSNKLDIIFYTQGLISWHFNHQFCAKCGSETKSNNSGHSRLCLSSTCSKEHFPRIEPAVIFSICNKASNTHPEDRILLARQNSWPEKRYSVIAGFVEHGESLENAVVREAYEEVGLQVTNVNYLGAQPWPFPASLMIGFTSETTDQEIRLIDKELECAQWFSASDIKREVKSGELLLPFSISISWRILDHWYRQQTGESIRSLKEHV